MATFRAGRRGRVRGVPGLLEEEKEREGEEKEAEVEKEERSIGMKAPSSSLTAELLQLQLLSWRARARVGGLEDNCCLDMLLVSRSARSMARYTAPKLPVPISSTKRN